ncbi:MAG: hypothetical protein II994_02425 [Lachnospiraceae bacterium]|nr:hypothetical protein [Lachnospiraceae bacterium]
MSEIEAKQYKVEQSVLNKLYKRLKQSTGCFTAERKELKKTLYNRCLQQIFIKKDSIKLTFIKRSEYNAKNGGDGLAIVGYLVNLFDFNLFDRHTYTLGESLCQEYIYYRDIKKAVYNEKMQRLEIYGSVKYKCDSDKKQKEVLMIYNLFDMRELIQSIETACNIKVTKV